MKSKEWQKLIDGRIDWLNEAIGKYVERHPTHLISEISENVKIKVIPKDRLLRIDQESGNKLREANYVTYNLGDDFYMTKELLDQQAEQMRVLKREYNDIFGSIKDTDLYEITHWLTDLAIFRSTKEIELDDKLSAPYRKFQPLEGLISSFRIKSRGLMLYVEGDKGYEHISNTSPRALEEFVRLNISNRILIEPLVEEGFFPDERTAFLNNMNAYSPSEAKDNVEGAVSFVEKLNQHYEAFVADYLSANVYDRIYGTIQRNDGRMPEGLKFGLMMSQMRGKLEYFPGLLDALYSQN